HCDSDVPVLLLTTPPPPRPPPFPYTTLFRSSEPARRPALAHLFWWFMFAQGGVIAALLVPAHVLLQGILGPIGIVPVVDRNYDTWINILGNPIVKLYLLVLIAFPFFHFAHRLRSLLVDLGVPAATRVPAEV